MLTKSELLKVFKYLDDLRDSGIVNMYGASSYVMDKFDWDKTKSHAALSLWMRTYSEDSVSIRVTKVLK